MDLDVKQHIIKSVKNIKTKLKRMREEDDNLERKHSKILKPVIDPLKAMVSLSDFSPEASKKNTSNEDDDYFNSCTSDEDSDDGEEEKKQKEVKINIKNSSEDTAKNVQYGIRNEGNRLMIGNMPVSIKTVKENSDDKISLLSINNNLNYEVTPGLSQLLFENKPDIKLVTEKDKLTYKDILINTNAHRRGFNSSGQIQGNAGLKYSKIIKPLFLETDTKNIKQGGRLSTVKKKYRSNTDLIYWDDPNELIERLKVLIASKDAGNTNHDNEIIAIVEELKEAGIIKG